MNIKTATERAAKENLWIMKEGRTDEFCLHVAAGSVYRNNAGDQVDLDARDCIADDWYLVDKHGANIS